MPPSLLSTHPVTGFTVISPRSSPDLLELFEGRLYVSCFIGYPASKFYFISVSLPKVPESHVGFVKYRFLKISFFSVFTGIFKIMVDPRQPIIG